jgi:hypothetical protein
MNDQIPHQSLLEQMAQIPQLERGKLCVVRQGPDGPYYNHQTWEKGKNVSRYVPRDKVQALQNAIDGYHRYQELSDQYVERMIEKTRAQMGGSKKKKPRPSSPLPKKRKSHG